MYNESWKGKLKKAAQSGVTDLHQSEKQFMYYNFFCFVTPISLEQPSVPKGIQFSHFLSEDNISSKSITAILMDNAQQKVKGFCSK